MNGRLIAISITLSFLIIASLIFFKLSDYMRDARLEAAGEGRNEGYSIMTKHKMEVTVKYVLMHKQAFGRYPTQNDGIASIRRLTHKTPGFGNRRKVPMATDCVDLWGNLYIYQIPGQNGADFTLISYGRDQAPGGTEANEDIILSYP
jgi:general secretion pathway protein G